MVKALHSKSNGVSPRRFEPCSQRSSRPVDLWDVHIRLTDPLSVGHLHPRTMLHKASIDAVLLGVGHLATCSNTFPVWSKLLTISQNRSVEVTPELMFFNFCPRLKFLSELLAMIGTHSCDDRVVKVLDLKSNGVSPRRFQPCSQRSTADGTYSSAFAGLY